MTPQMATATPIINEQPQSLLNPPQTRAAYLVWQSQIEHAQGTGRRYRVGLLRKDEESGGVNFKYLKGEEDFKIAEEKGFYEYIGIPFNRRDKNSEAFSLLERRLPPPNRPDFGEYLARFGLRKEDNLSPLSVLAYTGGRQISDSFSIAETFEGFDRPFQYIFDLAGPRHYAEQTSHVQQGDCVSFVAEPHNEYDPFAVALKDVHGNTLGYINLCHAEKVQSWTQAGGISNARIHRINGRSDYPRLFVICDIDPTKAV